MKARTISQILQPLHDYAQKVDPVNQWGKDIVAWAIERMRTGDEVGTAYEASTQRLEDAERRCLLQREAFLDVLRNRIKISLTLTQECRDNYNRTKRLQEILAELEAVQ